MSEFARLYPLADIGSEPRRVEIAAEGEERAALARRFGLVSLGSLSAEARLAAVDGAYEAQGTLSARLVQTCVATAEPINQTLDEAFRIRFVPEIRAEGDETELSADDCDLLTHDGQAIDLGEAVAQTLGLSIDPFPRAPDADDVLKAAGVMQEEDASPFAKLKGLFDKG